jgi:hypothetical protein
MLNKKEILKNINALNLNKKSENTKLLKKDKESINNVNKMKNENINININIFSSLKQISKKNNNKKELYKNDNDDSDYSMIVLKTEDPNDSFTNKENFDTYNIRNSKPRPAMSHQLSKKI